jgi:hypothetical protein
VGREERPFFFGKAAFLLFTYKNRRELVIIAVWTLKVAKLHGARWQKNLVTLPLCRFAT